MATEGVTESRRRGKGWSEAEEVCLIQEVVQREQLLFGEIKGSGVKSIHRQRTDGWQSITDILNTRHINAKREAIEVKKKYFNLKQRAKSKIDGLKRSMATTGGGPPLPALSNADEVLCQSLEGRPGIHGLEHGIDTDVIHDGDVAAAAPEGLQGEAHHIDEQDIPAKDKKTGRKRKRTQAEATYDNTIQDTERIKLEQRKLKLEIEVLEKNQKKLDIEIQMLQRKSVYYQLKMNAEFGVSLVESCPTEE
ncbi:uncharacterized protein LOC124150120 [Haliotis rufescens]|uniref:uncharacterized protein LOC124150120 n=1 Tax=Haliotis rufescens TaxID=6454 RepID=UPI00201E8877|nr:uncharacterized protein LOC124150120 [Haliotis rufescens]